MAKREVNLMTLLSNLDGITGLQPDEEEKEEDKESEKAPKLPRTNSLEDLGIKVLQFDCLHKMANTKMTIKNMKTVLKTLYIELFMMLN